MALPSVSSPQNNNNKVEGKSSNGSSKRVRNSGVRVKGSRIYDSENGVSCHQCRQKTRDFVATCKALKKGKNCTVKFCYKCLLNRYGEKAEEMAKLEDWVCPPCRGVCNCSLCMKKKGYRPTGILVHTAKATGFGSVSEFLHHKGPECVVSESQEMQLNEGLGESKGSLKKGSDNAKKEKKGGDPKEGGLHVKKERKRSRKENKENVTQSDKEVPVSSTAEDVKIKESRPLQILKTSNGDEGQGGVKPLLKRRKLGNKVLSEPCIQKIEIPQGSPLTTVGGIELPAEDIGRALQFLEFCNAFMKVLDIKKGYPEYVLQELTRGRVGRRGVNQPLAQFHIKLLSLIKEDMRKDGSRWTETLAELINESQCTLDKLPMNFSCGDSFRYEDLETSNKLKILNFLCDELLGTEKMRNWIDEANAKFDEKKKKNKDKVLAAKTKEKLLKQKLKDDIAKSMLSLKGGALLSFSEHSDIISEIKAEADKAHAETVETIELLRASKQKSDAVRTEPILFEGSGHAYWKLKGYNGDSYIIRQDIGNWDSITPQDKWFIYNDEEQKVVENYAAASRLRRHACSKEKHQLKWSSNGNQVLSAQTMQQVPDA